MTGSLQLLEMDVEPIALEQASPPNQEDTNRTMPKGPSTTGRAIGFLQSLRPKQTGCHQCCFRLSNESHALRDERHMI